MAQEERSRKRTAARGGRIVVPAFAVGRTQQLVYVLNQLHESGRIPNIPVFVDSPLAVEVTEVFRKHRELFDEEAQPFLANHGDPFGFKHLTYVRDVEASKALNDLHGPFMVISAGTRNHFALDLGLDREDPASCLAALSGCEGRRLA